MVNYKYMNIKSLILWIMAVALLAGCRNGGRNEQEDVSVYELLTVGEQDYTLYTEYPASVQGYQDIRIFPRVEGYLQGVFVKEGDNVREGQLLFRIDDVAYRAAVESANANVQTMTAALSRAQLEWEAKQSLRQKEVISDFELSMAVSDLNMAMANLAAAKAALASARNDLAYTEIRSPCDGVAGHIAYRKGDLVGPSMQECLTVVADNRRMRVYFSMTESIVMRYIAEYKSLNEAVKRMPDLRLRLPDGSFYDINGRVESISGVIDEHTGAVPVCALFDNPSGVLLSGGTGRIVMPTVVPRAIVIPQTATYEILDRTYVYMVVDGRAESAVITVLPVSDGQRYVVTGGLKAGDVIIAKGAGYVKEGQEVKL